MYTRLAKLFTQPVIDIKDIKRETESLIFNALYGPSIRADVTTLNWLNIVEVIESYSYRMGASKLVQDSHIADYLQEAKYRVVIDLPRDVRAFLDTGAEVSFSKLNTYVNFLEYPTPDGNNAKGRWWFI